MMKRRGDWMQTYMGRQFWPMDPRPEDVDIRDISHALGHLCRYGGHSRHFYSVAEHCILITTWLLGNGETDDVIKWGLMHDAAEAYVSDVPRPLKPYLTGYKDIEAGVMDAICRRFCLKGPMPDIVKEADNRILHDEKHKLMLPEPAAWKIPGKPLGVHIRLMKPETAENRFRKLFDRYFGEAV